MEIDYKLLKEIDCKQGVIRAVRFSGMYILFCYFILLFYFIIILIFNSFF